MEESALSGAKLEEKFSGFGDDVDEEEKCQLGIPAFIEDKKAKTDTATYQD
jgi:hypothetical protein